MGRSLTEFTSIIKARGVSYAHKFELQVYPPPFMINEDSQMASSSQAISLLAEMVQIPEFVLMTQPVRDTGEQREVVYDKIFPPVTATFICDGEMDVKMFFDTWVQGAMVSTRGTFRYPADYTASEMNIVQLDRSGTPVYRVVLVDVYPKIVNDIPLSAGSKDFNRCQVQFTYRNWYSEKL